jgi:ABC-type polysaccharide/polyol phosphate transport system ATPase subunit
MSDVAIRVEGLGKRYEIGGSRSRSTTLRELLADSAHRAARALIRAPWVRPETIWALRDVSFEVPRGHTLGIIGGNGAGKSTLLKILSRVTAPTTGEALIRGRVGSLLEVGTGFHPELTGRENIYLNGAVLGMRRAEIRARFDEIVAFAEVERFIDTPVKRYSSGMYLRLAFAVAAHLEPEILIVDEVLAVGDAEFQRKCLGKMDEVAGAGRTVLFVSHNMDAVRRLCSCCILLERGSIAMQGDADAVTSHYLTRHLTGGQPGEWIDVSHAHRIGTGEARIDALRYDGAADLRKLPVGDGPLDVDLRILAREPIVVRCLSLMINDRRGTRLINAELASHGGQLELSEGRNDVRIGIDQLHLNPGAYVVGVWIARTIEDEVPLDYLESAVTMEVLEDVPQGFSYPWATGPVTCSFAVHSLDASAAARNAPSRPT